MNPAERAIYRELTEYDLPCDAPTPISNFTGQGHPSSSEVAWYSKPFSERCQQDWPPSQSLLKSSAAHSSNMVCSKTGMYIKIAWHYWCHRNPQVWRGRFVENSSERSGLFQGSRSGSQRPCTWWLHEMQDIRNGHWSGFETPSSWGA